MKCSACGTELANGRCPFCGYRPTQEDMAAEAAWRRQKAGMSSGTDGDWRAERPKLPKRKPVRKPAAAAVRPERQQQPAVRRQPAPRQQPVRQPPTGKPKKNSHRTGTPLLVKLVIAAWILFCIWSFLQVLAGETGLDLSWFGA